MGTFLKHRGLVLAMVETAYGIDPAPTPAANAILVDDPKVKVTGEVKKRNFVRASFSPLAHVIGLKEVEISFKTELKGSGTAHAGGAADVPEIDPLLLACGMARTLVAETASGAHDGHIDYLPVSTGQKSATIYVYLDGVVHRVSGCVGNFKTNLTAGKSGEIEWNFKGLYSQPVDAAIPAGAVFNSQLPPPIMGAAFSIGGYAGIINSLDFDLANKIERRLSANAATGIAGFVLSERDTNGTMDPEAVSLATHDFWSAWEVGAQTALSFTIGSTSGAKIEVTAPRCVYRGIGWADRSGVRTHQIPFTMAQNAGDDEVKIKFY